MGLLENTIGAMLGHAPGQGSDRPEGGSPYAPMAAALIGLLAAKAATGGLGGLVGHPQAPTPGAAPPAPGDQRDGGLLSGLGALVDRFRGNGQAGTVESWVGPGANHPASPEQVSSAIGHDTVEELAQRTGMSPAEVAAQLSQSLPGLVDRLTPAGRLPRHDELPR